MDKVTFKNNLENIEIGTQYSPYSASKVVGEVLGREMRPQMIYNYVGKGYIKGRKVEGKWVIEGKDLREWVTKFAIRNVLDIQL